MTHSAKLAGADLSQAVWAPVTNWSGNCHTDDAPTFVPGLVAESANVEEQIMHATPHGVRGNAKGLRMSILWEGLILQEPALSPVKEPRLRRGPKLRNCLLLRCFRIAPEKAVSLPLRPLRIVRDFYHEQPDDVFVLACCCQVHRLVEIVRRRMVTVGQPVLVNLLLFRRGWGNIQRQRRNAVTNEAVLVAADENISQRLRIGFDGNSG